MALSTKKLYYRRAGITYAISLYTTLADIGNPTHYLCVRAGGATLYPAVTGTAVGAYSHLKFHVSGGTLWAKYSNPNILAGTYTFRQLTQLIAGFVANGATRTLLSPVRIRKYDSAYDITNVTQIRYITTSSSFTFPGAFFNGTRNGVVYATPATDQYVNLGIDSNTSTSYTVILRDDIHFS